MEINKARLSKPRKVAAKSRQSTKQIDAAEAKTEPEKSKDNVLPMCNFALEVDGRLKSEYLTAEAAQKAGLELKKKYPHIRVAVFNNKERARTAVELS